MKRRRRSLVYVRVSLHKLAFPPLPLLLNSRLYRVSGWDWPIGLSSSGYTFLAWCTMGKSRTVRRRSHVSSYPSFSAAASSPAVTESKFARRRKERGGK